jgi:hypothetical protein
MDGAHVSVREMKQEMAYHVDNGWRVIASKGRWLLLTDTTTLGYDGYAIFHWHEDYKRTGKRPSYRVYDRVYAYGNRNDYTLTAPCKHKCPPEILTAFHLFCMGRKTVDE